MRIEHWELSIGQIPGRTQAADSAKLFLREPLAETLSQYVVAGFSPRLYHFNKSYDVIRSILIKFPLRMASFSAAFKNGARRMRSTVTGQLNGMSVP